ncbi:dienelactone hydrolase family protein [Leptolyngbya iicbica]|uniref:Dienelactone hydrolase family protein n=2 Tax=Cyanophyceae TaxID=3028117 RepID=A0A4Q7EHH8_9CYAN|nr:dienelactone hydrolase family protein [Leptolyngbya sp. LK]RZM82478.1 dienelactone hydrolase family protein [Leptolyngbya sp. LK]
MAAATPPIQTHTVDILSQGLTIPAYLAHPTESKDCPAVVVIQEVFGVNAHIRAVTERIAQQGYIAISPHIYHRQAPGFEVGYDETALALGRQYKNGTQVDELLSDIQGAISYVQQHFTGVPQAVGCIGFCFGGHVAYLAATLPAIQATASFYGAGICQLAPGGGAPTISHTPDIHGTVYAFFGMQDPLITPAEVDEIEDALRTHQVDHRIYRYPEATHGFFCDQRASYDAHAAQDAWTQVLELFQAQLATVD